MHLINGTTFNLNDYSKNDFNIKDIAYALSMQCRWGGHTKTWFSVAEHCVRVAEYFNLSEGLQRYALLHDASEYIFPDLPSPLKTIVPDYKAESNKLQEAIYRYFGLGFEPAAVKEADWLIRDWEWYSYVTVEAKGWSVERAREAFLEIAERLEIR